MISNMISIIKFFDHVDFGINIISEFCTVASLVTYVVRCAMFVTGAVSVIVICIILYVLNVRVKAENSVNTNVCYHSVQKSLSFSQNFKN
jgi:isoprenylcysteine carboxyl methyltransferase (ICMT) family protein YpbQ